jgi:hypothetical protein
MRRSCGWGLRGVVGAALLPMALAIPAMAEEQSTMRDLVRRYNKDGNSVTLAKQIGFTKQVEHVVALEYTVLLRANGKETPAEPKSHQFSVGDRIRVKIAPVGDAYIYILHEGASGKRVCLLPTSEERAPFVKGGSSIVLPDDGYFEFGAPPGSEQLLVVATEKPIADLAALANVVFNKPDDQLTPAEKEVKKSIKAKVEQRLKSILQRQADTTTYRGLTTQGAMRDFASGVRQNGATDTVIEEPPHGASRSTFAMVASTRSDARPALYVTIPLRSVAIAAGRP